MQYAIFPASVQARLLHRHVSRVYDNVVAADNSSQLQSPCYSPHSDPSWPCLSYQLRFRPWLQPESRATWKYLNFLFRAGNLLYYPIAPRLWISKLVSKFAGPHDPWNRCVRIIKPRLGNILAPPSPDQHWAQARLQSDLGPLVAFSCWLLLHLECPLSKTHIRFKLLLQQQHPSVDKALSVYTIKHILVQYNRFSVVTTSTVSFPDLANLLNHVQPLWILLQAPLLHISNILKLFNYFNDIQR